MKIASEKLGRPASRALEAKCDIISRKANKKTPVAYIVNYPDNGGFAIVAADDRVEQVLAYNNSGSFSTDNEACMDMFVNKIEDYVDAATEKGEVSDINAYTNWKVPYEVTVGPKTVTTYDQDYPYNNYFTDYDNSGNQLKGPAGCGPVAVATILTHIKDYWVYDSRDYYFNIIRAHYQGNYSGTLLEDTPDGEFNYPPRSKSAAQDHVARLLKSLANGLKTFFNPITCLRMNSPESISQFLSSQEIPHTDWITHDPERIIRAIEADKLALMYGSCERGYHFWVCSGGQYAVISTNPDIPIQIYCLYFDWGWNGECNGFYNPSVMTLGNGDTFRVSSFMTVWNKK